MKMRDVQFCFFSGSVGFMNKCIFIITVYTKFLYFSCIVLVGLRRVIAMGKLIIQRIEEAYSMIQNVYNNGNDNYNNNSVQRTERESRYTYKFLLYVITFYTAIISTSHT